MATIKLLKKESYTAFINSLLKENRVYAPVSRGNIVSYACIDSAEEITDDFIISKLSPKSVVFPAIERLLSYEKKQNDIEVQDVSTDNFPPMVLVGARPCDARGISVLGKVFDDDPKDEIFAARLAKTTIIGFSCNKADADCFCTSMNGSPGDTAGSDLLFTQTTAGDYLVEVITEKGERLIAENSSLFVDAGEQKKEEFLAKVPKVFDANQLTGKIHTFFETDLFEQQALRCLGCGACAYVCPTCSCFDIQDETRGNRGHRIRCWDSCGFKLFTLHTSGHNPRHTQGQRWRQRLMHKFSYMPEKDEISGCVGCGRCSRACPVDMNLQESVLSIVNS